MSSFEKAIQKKRSIKSPGSGIRTHTPLSEQRILLTTAAFAVPFGVWSGPSLHHFPSKGIQVGDYGLCTFPLAAGFAQDWHGNCPRAFPEFTPDNRIVSEPATRRPNPCHQV